MSLHTSSSRVRSLVRSWGAYALLPAVGLATAPILARALGPVGRGELAAILQPLTVASAFAAIGVPTAVTYFLGRGSAWTDVRRIGVSTVAVTTLIVAGALVWYSTAVANSSGVPRGWLLLIWAAFLPSGFIAIARAAKQATGMYGAIDLERAGGAAFRLMGVVGLGLLGVSASVAFGVAYMIAGLVASLFLLIGARPSAKLGTTLRTRTLLRFSLVASIGTIATVLNSRLDQAILPAALDPQQLGYYSIAVTVAEVPGIITLVIVRNLLAEASAGAPSRTLRRTFMIGCLAISGSCALVALSASVLVPLVFGVDFAPAVASVVVLSLATALGFLSESITAVRMGQGRPGVGAIGPAAGAIATILLMALFWGSLSALVASGLAVASQAFALLAILISSRVKNRTVQGAAA